ncbi:MAG: hypothetical protein K2G63_05015 [Oscillospiraceae bacterium]|nr:hypothetical protein [Oscillospiraceae bacterium]
MYNSNFLNLDMVESQTERIIDYLYVDKSGIGSSVNMFDEGNLKCNAERT